jgi:hypothetical protein
VRTLGFITAGAAVALAGVAAVVGVLSVPDIRRYLKIRSM